MKTIDHIGIAVRNLDEGMKKWKRFFKFDRFQREDIQERMVSLIQLEKEGFPTIELISPLGPDSPVGRFLEKRGEGFHHICFEVEDLRAVMQEMKGQGMEFLQEEPVRGAEGSLIAFISPKELTGVLIELKEKKK